MDTYITIRIFCQIGCACFCFFALQGIKNRGKRSYYPNLPRSEKIRKSRRPQVKSSTSPSSEALPEPRDQSEADCPGEFSVALKFLLECPVLERGPDDKENHDDEGRDQCIVGTQGKGKTEHSQNDAAVHRMPDILVWSRCADSVTAVFLDSDSVRREGIFSHRPKAQ